MLKTLTSLLLVLAMPGAFLVAQPPMQNLAKTNWPNQLQDLLREHGLLLNQVIEANYQNKPETDIDGIKQKLKQNSKALSDMFSSILGAKAGSDFNPLFDEHIKLGGDYIMAAKNHQSTTDITKLANENGNKIANLFSKWFPSIPESKWKQMLADHVKLEADQVDAYFSNNMDKATSLKEKSLSQLRELGDLLIQGIQSLKSNP